MKAAAAPSIKHQSIFVGYLVVACGAEAATGQYINTAATIGSVGWICLNASWDSLMLQQQ